MSPPHTRRNGHLERSGGSATWGRETTPGNREGAQADRPEWGMDTSGLEPAEACRRMLAEYRVRFGWPRTRRRGAGRGDRSG